MGGIFLLDEGTVNKIAAGEVIDRPSSIIKELVENSIDAKATAITIEIEDGGINYIRVTDNGVGMDSKDAKASFIRHATSKIRSANDLDDILTLGFRGEALASIAAVTQMKMVTRTKDSLSGYEIINEGGKIIAEGEIGCPEGTTIIAKNLFFNTPARLKFLKSSRVETAYISEMTAKLILANPHISFKYVNNGKVIYYSSGDGDLKNAAFSIYGMNIVKETLTLEAREDSYGINAFGLLGMPDLGRKNRNHESFFVNGRYVKSDLLTKALETAYKAYLTINKFPWAIIHLGIPPNMIDVNVHPAKTEIRFKDEETVEDFLIKHIEDKLLENPYIPTVNVSSVAHVHENIIKSKGNIDTPEIAEQLAAFTEENTDYYDDKTKTRDISQINSVKGNPISEDFLTHDYHGVNDYKALHNTGAHPLDKGMNDFSLDNNMGEGLLPFRIVGRLFSTYIILEDGKQCYLMDQHAAHERLLFERYKKMLSEDKVLTQQLLPAAIIEVTHKEKIMIAESIDLFYALGFDIEEFGTRSYAVRGVPLILGTSDIKGFFHGLLDGIDEYKDGSNYKLKMEDIIRMSCKKAVKAGDKLSDFEVKALLRDVLVNKIPMTCPHGRPIMITISKKELEKSFKRIQ